jgi:hypothetical protein
VNRSSWCSDPNRGLNAVQKARCEQMLSRIPSRLEGLNDGLATLQWIKVKASPHNPQLLTGGTQDNGTWETNGNPVKWENTIIGDGGWNGFDVALPEFRFHSYFDTSPEVSFDGGEFETWIWVADQLFGQFDGNPNEFYSPIISDPNVSGTMFAGTTTGIWRTKTHGLGTKTYEEAQEHCNTWFGDQLFTGNCGDWVLTGTDQLDSPTFGADRTGGAMAAIERTTADNTTAWSATTRGRVFITKNVTAEPASTVMWTRLDDDSTMTPSRFVSSIHVDPANGNHAWVSYSGYGANTPGFPGHVFEVLYNPASGTSTWIDRSHNFGDLPVNDLVRDDATGDLYAATDFGVLRLAAGTTTWTTSAPGLPNVEVTSLEILADERILYGATHGLSTWRLNLD